MSQVAHYAKAYPGFKRSYYQLLCFLFPSFPLSLTSQGIVKALQEYQKKLLEHKVQIYVRRGGPNYQEGLRVMREVGKKRNWLTCCI